MSSEHTKNARPSTWDKHTNRDKGRSQKKMNDNPNWVDQGKHTNSSRNKARKEC